MAKTDQDHRKRNRHDHLLGLFPERENCASAVRVVQKQLRCSQLWGSARDLPYRFRGFHPLGCSTCLGRPFQCARRGRRMDWTGGQATHQLEQVISQPLASSTDSPLRYIVTSCPFPCAPECCRHRHPLLSVCQSFSPFVSTRLLLPAVCLAENRRLSPSLVHCIRARTRANNHYAANSPVSRAAAKLRHRLPEHLHDERSPQSQSTLQRGARLLAHHIPRWLKAAAPMLVRPDTDTWAPPLAIRELRIRGPRVRLVDWTARLGLTQPPFHRCPEP